jgi:5'-nucleotidase
MTILISNDDGIEAPGLAALCEALAGLDDLLVCAPAKNHSGAGSALTVTSAIHAEPFPDGPRGERRYAVHGTPVDAVKFGLVQIMKPEKPRLVVSGINYGPNIGQNVRYSGTVGAALEGAWAGIPSLATSSDFVAPPNWETPMAYTRRVVEWMLTQKPPLLLNLNSPMCPLAEAKGIRAARHGASGYEEFFIKRESDGKLQLSGAMRHRDEDVDADGAVFLSGYASLTPLAIDWTARDVFGRIKDLTL